MASTRSFDIGHEQCSQQVDRLTKSHSLRGSESLCKLLRYLAEQSLDHPGAQVKEYQIAVEVLGRSGKFDPQNDSTVRVQAGRLRLKLEEYYSHEAPDDPVAVELPKGSYTLTFHLRAPAPVAGLTAIRPRGLENNRPVQVPVSNAGWAVGIITLSILLAAALVTIGILLAGRARNQAGTAAPIPTSYQIFWGRFVADQPWLIFSNASFVGRPQTAMRYFNPSTDSKALVFDHYTGVGEVLAIHELDRVFSLFNRQLRTKRGALFSLDDAKNNDLIFVGSPAENLALLDIPGTTEFVFEWVPSGPQKGYVAVRNAHPQAGEPRMFYASIPDQAITEDYAVIALVPAMDPSHSLLILAGTTTLGTQAAAEFVCRGDSLAELLKQLGVSSAGELKPFEALLRVKVAHGVPVKTDLVAVRKRDKAN